MHGKRFRTPFLLFREIFKFPTYLRWVDKVLHCGRSQTYISPPQNKLTFLSLEYSKKPADEFTTSIIEQAKSHYHQLNNAHKKPCCEVYVEFGPTKEKYGFFSGNTTVSEFSEKFTLKPENMKLPLFCRPWFFWLFTVLPFPFFNGVLLRMIITKFYSVEIKKPIVQYIQILPETGSGTVPVMDISKGYQVTQSVMDLVVKKAKQCKTKLKIPVTPV